jgi:hypothetical protein
MAAKKTVQVIVDSPHWEGFNVNICNQEDSPLVMHKFSTESQEEMAEDAATKGKSEIAPKKRRAHTPENDCARALHHVGDKPAIPAMAIKNAMIRAAGQLKYVMSDIKTYFRVIGVMSDGTQYVLLGEPADMVMDARPVRIGPQKVAKMAYRPRFDVWTARLYIKYKVGFVTPEQLTNILAHAGDLGLLEGRPSSPKSVGMDWGRFELVASKRAKE